MKNEQKINEKQPKTCEKRTKNEQRTNEKQTN